MIFYGLLGILQKRTFDMLDAEFFDESRREHARRKRTTENGAKLLIETTNTHILKLEVRRNDSVRRCLLRTGLYPDLRTLLFHERHVRLFHHYARVHALGSAPAPAALLGGEFEHADALDDTAEVHSVILEHDDLSYGEHDAGVPSHERGAHIVRGELYPWVVVPLQKPDFEC